MTSLTCSSYQERNSCQARTGCSWVNNCRSIGTDCSALTSAGASVCVNTPVTTGLRRCAWFNNACRAQTCDDLSAALTSHDACRAISATCTTRGAGCIAIGACSTYPTEAICRAARTTQPGDTCIWDNTACRAKRCSDAPSGTNTDAACETFLTGCKTDGTKCINPGFACTSLITATACCRDGSGRPCLWVAGICYNYAKCDDITLTTHAGC